MLKTLKYYVILIAIIFTSSIFAVNVNFSDPTSTPPGTPPDLSDPLQNALRPQIATDSSGRYVYAIWDRSNGTNTIIQVAISSDFGNTWQDPASTPTGIIPNLSAAIQNAQRSQIATDSSGRYVYATWDRSDGANNIVQAAISSDFGNTWHNPITSPPGTTGPPNLSIPGQNALSSQIATDNSGRFVYVVWDSLTIQVAISTDFGKTWQNPTSTPPGTTSPDLSVAGLANEPQIATDSTGRYVYVNWFLVIGGKRITQVAISSDFGNTWQNPISTPPGTTSPNLSVLGENINEPQIATDGSGRYVYSNWTRDDGTGNFITQVVISSDFGNTWQNPITTPPGTTGPPNLSVPGQLAGDSHLATNFSGQYVYALWDRSDGTNLIIQAAISSDFGNTWHNPISTPEAPPNLSEPGQDARENIVKTDTSGRYIYSIWFRFDGSNNVAQVAFSSDFGNSWQNPTSTPPGTIPPNLSDPGGTIGLFPPQIAIDSTGRFVYAIWERVDGSSNNIVQVANGNKTFFPIVNLGGDRTN